MYVERTLGPCPAFVCLFVYVLLGPVGGAIMARTFAEYLLPLLGLQCHTYLVIVWGVLLNCELHMLFQIVPIVFNHWNDPLCINHMSTIFNLPSFVKVAS